jgi:chemotaxis protein MotB
MLDGSNKARRLHRATEGVAGVALRALCACALLIGSASLGFGAGGCGYSEEEMQIKRDRIDQLTRALDKLEQEHRQVQEMLKATSAQNAELAQRLEQMGVSVEDTLKNMKDLNQQVDELRAKERQAQARLQTFRDMLGKFKRMIESGELRVRIQRGRMVVELSENILFDSGKADLKKQGQTALAEVARVLASIPDREFQITGHTDNVPIRSARFPSNWELSTGRALTVARFLAAQGVPETRLSAAGYADTQPVASNDTPDGRAQNRRIEIVLMPNLEDLPDLSQLEQTGTK